MATIQSLRYSPKKHFIFLFLLVLFNFCVLGAEEDLAISVEYQKKYLIATILNHTTKSLVSRCFDVSVNPLIVLIHEKEGLIKDRFWSKPIPVGKKNLPVLSQKRLFIRPGVQVLPLSLDSFNRFKFNFNGSYYLVALLKKGYSISNGFAISNYLKLEVFDGQIVSQKSLPRNDISEPQREMLEAIIRQVLAQES